MSEKVPAIDVKNFGMRFGDRWVIEDLSFDVAKGEVFGFLGSNGSGKTTTIRALLGLYKPTRGSLLVNGKSFSAEAGQRLGYLPEERGLYKKESVLDTMVYFGRLKGLSGNAAKAWSLDYLAKVDLAEMAEESIDKLSGGMQQKVQLGVTMMNEPELLILDEPTKSFDPVNRRLLMEMIDERVRAGSTVVLVTHQMEEVERVCDRIMLLKDGKRRLYGTVDEVKRQFGTETIGLQFKGKLTAEPKLFDIEKPSDQQATLLPKDGIATDDILNALIKQGLHIESFVVQRPSLDDIFVQIYQQEGGAHA